MSLNRKMSEKHEEHLADVFGGKRSPGSGNQWAKPIDGRQSRYDVTCAFAWDGKSTMAKSMSIPRSMLDKAVDQAEGERPMIAIRFYDDERLRGFEDWDLVREEDMTELMARDVALRALEVELEAMQADPHSIYRQVWDALPSEVQGALGESPTLRKVLEDSVLTAHEKVLEALKLAVMTG